MSVILQIFTLLGSLALFLYGMTLMSESLQKVAGSGLRSFLASMTSNPFKRVLTGLFITAVIQSSSATTVMVVSFVNAGLLSLIQAIGVIMGANIGTTVTAWIISLLGFKADISILSIPLIAVGFVFKMLKSNKKKTIGDMIIGFALLFMGLSALKSSVPDLNSTPEVLEFLRNWTSWGFWSILIFVGIGTLLTIVLQSSSATMALTLVMVSMGWIPFEIAAAMVMGENIGTTITANIAASVGNVGAKRAALAHTVFNLFGVLWVLILFKPFLNLVANIITNLFGYPDPFMNYSAATSQYGADVASTGSLYAISMVHTLFNLFNTLLLIWFVPLIEKLVVKLIPQKQEDEIFKLTFIQGGVLSTPELSLEQAQREIVSFAKLMKRQNGYTEQILVEEDDDKFDALFKKLEHYEEVADRIEFEIASYLNQVAEFNLSDIAGRRVQAMYRIVGELESIGDSGYNLGRILQRKRLNGSKFDEDMNKKLLRMIHLLNDAFDAMIENLDKDYVKVTEITNAVSAEEVINDYRDALREEHLRNLENQSYNYLTGVYYIDLVNECEKMGDYMINISESVLELS